MGSGATFGRSQNESSGQGKTALDKRTRWLVTVWATDGKERDVAVVIPKSSKIRDNRAGSMYRATLQNGQPSLSNVMTLLNAEPITPTSDSAKLALLKKSPTAKSAVKRSIN